MINGNLELNFKAGRERRDEGIQRAERKANAVHEGWSDKAFDFLKGYIEINPMFMTEDVRFASQGIVPSPPSQRSWGAVIRRAVCEGLIVSAGQKNVRNVKAHRAFASVWKSLIVKR